MGKLAKRMLSIMRNIFEAFIYVIFPIVMLLAMLPVAGKVLMGYIKVLFWINMWPPLYAVLHFTMSYYGQNAASAAVVQAGSSFPIGLSVMTNTGLGHVLSDYAAIAGYLSLSIPMIAWMMVSQSGAMMAGLAGRLMQSYDTPVFKAADEATTGNLLLGECQIRNRKCVSIKFNA
ncbi:conjugal transfer protein TraG N-terminal domain-containing protein [Candidatus Enterovibrio altilux]|uniref:conjugal transfer protein TraG N-terminal domain-containing protein n=1 Tax=Candidatus Enterovibrio altilux TaxID=1927128 RepID=UPI000BBBD85F